jgi:hypothetical protein
MSSTGEIQIYFLDGIADVWVSMVEGLEEECELEEEEGRPLERQVTFELSEQLEQLMVSGTRGHSKVAF